MKNSRILEKLLIVFVLLAVLSPAVFSQTIGTINTVAGGVPNNVPALSYGIGYPTAIARDTSGNFYAAIVSSGQDIGGIIKIDPNGILTTIAGNGSFVYYSLGGLSNGDGGPASQALIGYVTGLAVDSQGNIYISDTTYSTIREVSASTGIINAIAGGGTGCANQTDVNGDGCPATSATLKLPYQLYVDANLNLYIADVGHDSIREVVASTGIIQLVAGGGTGCANPTDAVGDGCPATSATLSGPEGVYLDATGDIFISDTTNNRIREVNASTGIIQTIAGTGTGGYNGDNILATTAEVYGPTGIFVDSAGNVYFGDLSNARVREIVASNSFIQTIVGGGTICTGETDSAGDGCPASDAFTYPYGVYVDSSNNLYVADYVYNLVRKVVANNGVLNSSDTIEAFAGNGTVYFGGDGGAATSAELNVPYGVAADAADNFFIADTGNQRIRKVSAGTGIISTVAGGGTGCAAETNARGDGCPATQGILSSPTAVFVDASDDIFILDAGVVREVSASTGIISTVAGGGSGCANQTDTIGDGCLATQAELDASWGLYVAPNGNIFISDVGNNRIREVVASTGIIQSIAGTGTPGYNGDNISALSAEISYPTGIYGDSSGNIYFADLENSRIREIVASTGLIQTVAGTGTPGYSGDGGSAVTAEILEPYGLFVDNAANIFFADYGNFRIREVVASTGIIQTVGGDGTFGFSGDGGPATSAEVSYIPGLSGDTNGDIFLADSFDLRIREIFGIVPANTLTITTPSLPAATVGTPYSFTLTAIDGTPPYTWSIPPVSVIPFQISTAGVLTGTPASPGTVSVPIQVNDSASHVATHTYSLTVNSAATLQSITVAPATFSMDEGATVQFTATGQYSDGSTQNLTSTAIWSSTYASIATVNSAGVATGVGPGTTTITATSGNISGTASLSVTSLTGASLVGITVFPATPTLGLNTTQSFTAIGTFSDGSTQNLTTLVTWSSNTTSVANVSATGVVTTGTNGGTSTISATLGSVIGSTDVTVATGPPYAYIGSITTANCCLNVLNTSTNQVVGTVPVTDFNEPFGITPDQTRLYIADNINNLVNVIDTTTHTLVTTIPVGLGATDVSVTPNGQFGYVATFGETNISVFSVSTNSLVTKVPITFLPYWDAVTPDGASVYVTGLSGNSVTVINTSTNTVSSTFTIAAPAGETSASCLSSPVFNSTVTVGYILQQPSCSTTPLTTPGFVNVISLPNNTPVTTIPVGIGAFNSALSADGTRLYVTNNTSNTLSVIDTSSNTVIATVSLGEGPSSLSITPDGTEIYVTNTQSSSISVVQTSTNTVTATVSMTTPFGIAILTPPPAPPATVLTLTPPNLIFNPQVVSTTSTPQTITVTNPGTTPVTLTSVALTGPNLSEFSLTNGCPVPPATLTGSCNLQTTFTPSATGAQTALVTINSTNGEVSYQQSAPLTGSGTGSTVATFSSLTPSQTIVAGATSINLAGVISNGSTFPTSGEFVYISIGGIAQTATVGTAGTFSTTFTTSAIPASSTPYTITYFYSGDATLTSATDTSTTLTVNGTVVSYTLTVTPIGTGSGTVTDNLQEINCVLTAGVTSGTCSASYPAGTPVTLSAVSSGTATFAGWGGACSGTTGCLVTMNSALSVTASFTPPPQPINLTFTAGTTQTGMATYDCPSNPNPTPTNPCTEPNAHALALSIPQVLTPFTITVQATEVPPSQGNGICPNGDTPTQDFDCRFVSFFTYSVDANGDEIVPLCVPYANGNCVHYLLYSGTPGTVPSPADYVGPIDWTITWNNGTFVPPAPYTGSTPQLYDDPDQEVTTTAPYGTSCTTPMQINGNPTNPAIYCQFVFNITTGYLPTKGVDPGITGRTKNFNDVVVAFPPTNVGNLTITDVPLSATVTAGSPIGFTITVTNSAGGPVAGAVLNDLLPTGSNVNWTISPAYTGPGTCAITGTAGSQALSCSFGTIAASQTFTIGLLSSGSSIGTYTDTATTQIGNQQLLSIGTLTVQGVTTAFSGLTPSQTIQAGTSSITLGGIIGNGTQFPPTTETVSITIGSLTQTAAIGANGTFSTTFQTSSLPASSSPYTITYSYAGDGTFSAASNTSTALTVSAPATSYTLTVTPLGTGNGTVIDNLQQIDCITTAGVQSGTCSASYTSGTTVVLTATANGNSSFAGWGNACNGTETCTVTMTSAQTVTASFTPPPQLINLTFNPGTTVTGMATYDCPSNPNPTPTNPCTDPNAHALAVSIPQVLTPFTITVQATEVPPSMGNGICPNGDTPTQDFDCRFVSFFTYGTDSSGDEIVPLCDPYANGNCVHYLLYSGTPGTEPNPSYYVGPIDWEVTWNNGAFVPPAPYTGSIPQLYDDPDQQVTNTAPYGINCSTPMQINGNPTNPPIYCQFVFDITTAFLPTKGVDPGITGRTKNFNDVVVAFPPANVGNLTVTDVPLATPVVAGNSIGFIITVTNSAGGAVTGASLTDVLPAGTNVNWAISPAYAGPGTCAITGAVGSQVLSCSFGTISASQTFTISLLSANSSIGTYTDTTTTQIGSQQILSIGTLAVTGVTASFSNLTPSETISSATTSINLSGVIGGSSSYPASGEKVSISIGSVTQQATIGANGTFSTTFPTTALAASTTPYPITYSYPGDSIFTAATNTSTTLTVTSSLLTQTITLHGVPASAVYDSNFTVSASASSGLPVTLAASGACSLGGYKVTMTSGTGTCTVTASQAGNATYAPAKTSQNVTAEKANSMTSITSTSPNPSTVSQSVAIAFSVSGVTVPTGTVTVTASTGETCTWALAGGKGSCTITFATSGSRTLIAAYSGNSNFNGSVSGAVTQVVNSSTSTSTLVASPTSVNFGQVPLGGLALGEVKLTNTGKSSINISKIAMSKTGTGDFDDFFVISLCPGTLKAGASCVLGVGYVPDRDDVIGVTSSTSVLITDNAVGSPQSVPLQAITINPKATLGSTLLSFGSEKAGSTSAVKTVTVKSTGTSPLVINSISVTGNFALATGTTCAAGQSLTPPESCTIALTFTPTKTGYIAGALNISDNTLYGHNIVVLTGTGTK